MWLLPFAIALLAYINFSQSDWWVPFLASLVPSIFYSIFEKDEIRTYSSSLWQSMKGILAEMKKFINNYGKLLSGLLITVLLGIVDLFFINVLSIHYPQWPFTPVSLIWCCSIFWLTRKKHIAKSAQLTAPASLQQGNSVSFLLIDLTAIICGFALTWLVNIISKFDITQPYDTKLILIFIILILVACGEIFLICYLMWIRYKEKKQKIRLWPIILIFDLIAISIFFSYIYGLIYCFFPDQIEPINTDISLSAYNPIELSFEFILFSFMTLFSIGGDLQLTSLLCRYLVPIESSIFIVYISIILLGDQFDKKDNSNSTTPANTEPTNPSSDSPSAPPSQ